MEFDAFVHMLRKNGYRDTQPRRLVLEALHTLKQPASPYDIQEWITKRHNLNISPVTAYRVIDLFIELGLVHKHPCGGGFILCSDPTSSGLHGYMHCHDCGTSEEFVSNELAGAVQKQSSKYSFRAGRALLEVPGVCHSCSSH